MQTATGEGGYLALARDILTNGQDTEDRTGVGTRSVFGRQLRFDLTKGFPLLTTKKIFRKGIVHELLWFLKGDTNIAYLLENDVHIWDEWADAEGNLGPVYGKQWRSWPSIKLDGAWLRSVETIDQIANVVASLTNNPHGRRHIVSAWNPAEVDDMALPPCHCLFQFYVRRMTRKQRIKDGGWAIREALVGIDKFDDAVVHPKLDELGVPKFYLDCQLYQRSADLFLGVPFNNASYALLTHMIAQQVNMEAGEFVHTFGDVHIYRNHQPMIHEQLSRDIRPHPTLVITKAPSIFDYTYENFEFVGYNPHPAIKAPVAV